MDLRSRMRLLGAIGLLAGACAPAISQEAPSGTGSHRSSVVQAAPASDVLALSTAEGLRALDTSVGKAGAELAHGVLTRDGSTAYGSTSDGRVTTVRRVEMPTGEELDRMKVKGAFVSSIVSGDGELVALTERRAEGITPWLPAGRARTPLVVASPSTAETRRYSLKGNFEPEAFSTSNDQMFLIKYMPALAPSHYALRRLDLASGKLLHIGRLKQFAPRVMRGTGRMQVLDPDGTRLYTLYTQQGPGYSHEETAQGESSVRAFVHVLNLEEGWAHCIDLPMPFGTGMATASAMTIAPNGRRLFVSEWANGVIATIDPRKLSVPRTTDVKLGGADDQTFARAGSNGIVYVAGDSSVVALNASDLAEVDRWDMGSPVMGLAVSDDAERVYVTIEGELLTVDSRSGSVVDRLKIRGAPKIDAILAG